MELFDIFKAIKSDIESRTDLPDFVDDSIPSDRPSIRMALNNPDESYPFQSGDVTQFEGEINVQISHKLGTNDLTMLNLAKLFRSHYDRNYTFTANGVRIPIQYIRTSSIYNSDANRHINLVIGFVAFG